MVTILFTIMVAGEVVAQEPAKIKPENAYYGHTHVVTSLAPFPGPLQLVSGSGRYSGFESKDVLWKGEILFWDLKSRSKSNAAIDSLDGVVTFLEPTKDERFLLIGSYYGQICFWDIKNKKTAWHYKELHDGFLLSLRMDNACKHAYSGGLDKKICVIDVSETKGLIQLEGHKLPVCLLDVSRDDSLLISIGSKGRKCECIVWDCAKRTVQKKGDLQHEIRSIAFVEARKCLFADSKGDLYFLDVGALEPEKLLWTKSSRQVTFMKPITEEIIALASTDPNASKIATAHRLHFFNLQTRQMIAEGGIPGPITCIAFSKSRNEVYTGGVRRGDLGGFEGQIYCWKLPRS